MLNKPNAFVVAAFGLGPLLLAAGCGGAGSDGDAELLVPVQSSSYVTIEAATTTTTTTILLADVGVGQVSPVQQEYTVVSGDSISKIAGLYDITMDVLVNFNAWSDGTSHFLQVGDKVLIPPNAVVPGAATADTAPPAASGGETADPATQTTQPPAAGAGCQHTVVENDNPTRVAQKYDISVGELAAANSGNSAYNTFLIGSSLNIPANGSC